MRPSSLDDFRDALDKQYAFEYDMTDVQEEHSDELFDTGSVTVKVGDRYFVLALVISEG